MNFIPLNTLEKKVLPQTQTMLSRSKSLLADFSGLRHHRRQCHLFNYHIVADDFGLSNGINRAIIDLVDRKIIQAVSCMTIYPEFFLDAHRLKNQELKIGLHLTLTGKKTNLPFIITLNIFTSFLIFNHLGLGGSNKKKSIKS